MSGLKIVLIVLALLALALAVVAYRLRRFISLVRNKEIGANRDYLWNLLYSLDWSGTTTNNYGYAPAETSGPERFQLQMYSELAKPHLAKAKIAKHTNLLEVSCGQGGGRWTGGGLSRSARVLRVNNWPRTTVRMIDAR